MFYGTLDNRFLLTIEQIADGKFATYKLIDRKPDDFQEVKLVKTRSICVPDSYYYDNKPDKKPSEDFLEIWRMQAERDVEVYLRWSK